MNKTDEKDQDVRSLSDNMFFFPQISEMLSGVHKTESIWNLSLRQGICASSG